MAYTDYARPVVRGDIEKAIKAYKRLCQEEGISKTLREGKYFMTRTQKRKKKAQTSQKPIFKAPRKSY